MRAFNRKRSDCHNIHLKILKQCLRSITHFCHDCAYRCFFFFFICHIYALFPFLKYIRKITFIDYIPFLFEALLDNYVLDPTKPDPTDAQKLKEENNFINAIAVKGGPVDVAYKYLLAKKKTTAKVRSCKSRHTVIYTLFYENV